MYGFPNKKMNEGDVDQVYALGNGQKEFSSSIVSFWTKEQLEGWCKSDKDLLFVVVQNGNAIGFSLYAMHQPTRTVKWENLFVIPEMRKSGVGTALIKKGLESIKAMGYSYISLVNNSSDEEGFARLLEGFGFVRASKVLWMDRIEVSSGFI